jgi:hypothetical protein
VNISRSGEHHEPPSVTHAEADYLRMLTAVTDPPTLRAESAIRRDVQNRRGDLA